MRLITIMMRRGLLATAIMLGCSPVVQAIDGFAFEAGHATQTDMMRVAAQWKWQQRWFQTDSRHLGGYWDLSLAEWDREHRPGETGYLTEIGLTPVFRLQSNDLRGLYLEGGIGVHLLSSTQVGNKRFGTAFQFGDHLGFGYRFGARGAMDISYRYQHLSNADIKQPNNGIDFQQIRLQYWFE